mmetsp:Transcript_47171/g.86580  ORF Transcript_47171/g.86580 Transcript_47171/m.86580 type:complete len:452 (+) Transcript_47171:118-1473(+)
MLADLRRSLLDEEKIKADIEVMQKRRWKGHPLRGVRSILPTECACTLVLLVFTGIPAWLFYMLAAGTWSHGEALYFALVTLTTVGYGDYVPPGGNAGKVLLIVLVWWNALVVNIVVGVIGASIERRLERVGQLLGRRLIGSRRIGIECVHFVAMVVLFLTFAICFYRYEEKNWADGVFFAVVTLTTTGYGHLTPSAFRLLAGPIVLFGVAAWEAISGHFSEVVQDSMNRAASYRTRSQRRRVAITLTSGTIFLTGSAFFAITSQGWTLQECCYFCAVTLTTVGFGDYIPFGTQEELWLATVFILLATPFLPMLLDALGSEAVQLWEDLLAFTVKRAVGTDIVTLVNGKASIRTDLRRWVHMLLLGTLILGGAVIFSWVESWTLLEGVYFASVTLTTVGYGDMCPSTPLSRGLAALYVLFCVPTAGSLVESLSNGYSSTLRSMLRRPGRQVQ